MGATPYFDDSASGVTFRVWAPFASSVAVAGEFNQWSSSSTPLYPEGGGTWSADVPGAEVSQRYLFYIPSCREAPWRMDPYARGVACGVGRRALGVISPSRVRHVDVGYAMPPWNELVIYQVNLRSLVRWRDPTPWAYLLGRLDYLRDLGINAVELVSFGEWLADEPAPDRLLYPFAVDDAWGGRDGLRTLVNEAHLRGIAVLLNVDYSHLSGTGCDMWRFDGHASTARSGGIYVYEDRRSRTPWGETRFDYGRPQVRDYLRDNALGWLHDCFVDGLRWSSVRWIRNVEGRDGDPANDLADGWSLMQWINDRVRREQPWKISVASDMNDSEWITKDASSGGAGFDSQWSGRFAPTVRAALAEWDDASRDLPAVATAIAHTYNASANQRVVFTEAYDADTAYTRRLPECIHPGKADSWESKKRAALAAALVLTAPGIPMLLAGQEFLSWDEFHPGRGIDWSRAEQFPGFVNLHRDLIRLRRNWFDTTRGLRGDHVHVFHVDRRTNVVAFHRWDRGGPRDDVVIALNVSTQGRSGVRIGLPREGPWRVRYNGDWSGYDPDFGNWFSGDVDADRVPWDGMPMSAEVSAGPYTALVLSQD
jgi:1,4-alpha-glucan branching enzyme